jgi:hypothetical protein
MFQELHRILATQEPLKILQPKFQEPIHFRLGVQQEVGELMDLVMVGLEATRPAHILYWQARLFIYK